jgi:hypothetical protein
VNGFFKERKSFGAVAGFGKSHGALWTLLRLSGSSDGLCRSLGVGRKRGQERNRSAKAKLKESIHGSIVHPTLARQTGLEKERQAPKRLPFLLGFGWKFRI